MSAVKFQTELMHSRVFVAALILATLAQIDGGKLRNLRKNLDSESICV